MLLLDTNYLIRSLKTSSQEFVRVSAWRRAGEILAAPAVCWHEFCCGPVGDHECAMVLALLRGGILPFGEDEAVEAAKLFNAVNRQRSLRMDCLIAATAIVADAPLATSNVKDFTKFQEWGLHLA